MNASGAALEKRRASPSLGQRERHSTARPRCGGPSSASQAAVGRRRGRGEARARFPPRRRGLFRGSREASNGSRPVSRGRPMDAGGGAINSGAAEPLG